MDKACEYRWCDLGIDHWGGHPSIALDMAHLGQNMDVVAGLATVHRLAYTKGFDDATMLREFCEPAIDGTYFPIADTRPTVERLEWATKLNTTGTPSATLGMNVNGAPLPDDGTSEI